MSTTAERAAAIAVVILIVLMVAILVLRSLGVPLAVGPLASATPVVASPTPPNPSPSGSQDPAAVFARIEEQVQDLRDLPPADIGPPEVITRAQLADELASILDESWTPGELANDNLTLRALGLLGEEQDIRELTEQLYAGQVLGFYDFEETRMVVVSDAGLTPEAEISYAHEYTHALQDAAFETGALREEELLEQDDVALAHLALEEGDATLVMFQWALGNLPPEDLAGIGQTPVPDTTGIPEWMVEQLTFPYVAGFTFVSRLQTSGGWSAVDAAYDDPPESTEQVLHPEKYLDAESPIEVDPIDLPAALGGGWEEAESSTIGEAMVGIWLAGVGVDKDEATVAGAGWGGDRLTVARGPDGAWALAWRMAWDAPNQAAEFEEAYAEASPPAGHATELVRVSESETVVLHASSEELLAAARAAVE